VQGCRVIIKRQSTVWGRKGACVVNGNIGSMLLQSIGITKEKVAVGYGERSGAKSENYLL